MYYLQVSAVNHHNDEFPNSNRRMLEVVVGTSNRKERGEERSGVEWSGEKWSAVDWPGGSGSKQV